jgi:hypothetical protein
MTRLPFVVSTYLTTPKTELGPMIEGLFTPDAVVRDDGQTHVGADAVRVWAGHVATAPGFTRTVTGSVTAGDAVIVTARLAGDFPGSPVDLHHHFTVTDGRISALTICP